MNDYVMNKNYAKTFRLMAILFVILAVLTATVIPLSLSRQISDAVALERQQEALEQSGGDDGGHGRSRDDREDAIKSQITPLSAINYVIIIAAIALWAALALVYWLSIVTWLYKSAVNEGMNKSLWPILGLFLNIFAVFAFCIVRDRPQSA